METATISVGVHFAPTPSLRACAQWLRSLFRLRRPDRRTQSHAASQDILDFYVRELVKLAFSRAPLGSHLA